MTHQQLIAWGRNELLDVDNNSLNILFEHSFGVPFYKAILFPEEEPCSEKIDFFKQNVTRRVSGEPVQYIVGHWPFAGFDFFAEPEVLIPRDDTMVLLETARPFLTKDSILIDMCTGSGILGISLSLLTGCTAICADISPAALNLTQKNIGHLNATNATAQKSDVLNPSVANEFPMADVIVSNPPYIKTGVLASLQPEVQKEPVLALDGGTSGLVFYEALLQNLLPALKNNGWLLVEIGYDQGAEVTALFEQAGLQNIQIHNDLSGLNRVVQGQII